MLNINSSAYLPLQIYPNSHPSQKLPLGCQAANLFENKLRGKLSKKNLRENRGKKEIIPLEEDDKNHQIGKERGCGILYNHISHILHTIRTKIGLDYLKLAK